MAISLERSIAYRCGSCGIMNIKNITIFDLPKNQESSLICKCGTYCTGITLKKDKYKIFAPCPYCLDEHVFSVGKKAFWDKEFMPFNCHSAELGVFCIGNGDFIENFAKEQDLKLEQMYKEDFSFSDADFENDAVMLKILDRIHEIANSGNIFCTCGSNTISFSVNADAVDLYCEECKSVEVIRAANMQDAEDIENRDCIVIKCSNPQPMPDKPR